MVELVRSASQHQPVVFVLDDLQWADAASLHLLRHVIAADRSMRLLVLATYRDDELRQSPQLTETLAALHRQPGVAHIELSGLDDAGVVSLMEAVAGHTLGEAALDLATAVHDETDGNPFFVSEVLRHLAETGTISQDATGRWVAESDRAALPASVRVVIRARVERLGADAARALTVAAVIGRDFELDALGRATDMSENELLDLLDAATSVALVRELADAPGHYSFAHALIQHTLYEDLGVTRRAKTHRQVAEALEDLAGERPGTQAGELARHWINASRPDDLAKGLDYSRQAGDDALRALAPADALGYYTQALNLLGRSSNPDPILGIDLAIGLGTAQRQTGDPAFRTSLLDAARRAADLGETARLATAALATNRGAMFSSGGIIDTEKVEVLELALDRLPIDHPDRARVLATLCVELTYGSPLERRKALADEAIAVANASGDDATIAWVLNSVCWPLLVPPLLAQGLARAAEALVRARRVGDPVLLLFAGLSRAQTAARAGDIDEMDRGMEIVSSMAEQLDQPTMHWIHRYMGALRAQIAGDTEQTERLATEALQIGTESGQPDAAVFYGGQLVVVAAQRGTLDELLPMVEHAVATVSEDTPALAGSVVAGSASIYVEVGRVDDAHRVMDDFAAAGYELVVDPNWLSNMVAYAEVAIVGRIPHHAEPLFEHLVPWAEQLPTAGTTANGPVSHYLGGLAGVLARYDEADAYFARAAAFNGRANARFFATRTNLWWGQMLAERNSPGDAERARELITSAHVAAVANGYASVERRATEALQRLS